MRSTIKDLLRQLDENTDQIEPLLGGLGNVSTNVSEVSFRILNLHSTASDIDSRISVLNATASLLSDQLRRDELIQNYVRFVASSGVSEYVTVNPPVGSTTIIPAPGLGRTLRIHAVYMEGAVLHSNPSRRCTFEGGNGEVLLACHAGASNAANAGVMGCRWAFNNVPLVMRSNTAFVVNPATGWTVQCTITVHATDGIINQVI